MNKTAKIIAIFLILTACMSAYAFAAFLGVNTKPLPEPVNLLITGSVLFITGHFIRHITKK
jgi:fatty acid desaturase